ncbi:MAG: hypothetical protein PSN46_05745 [Gammaproteobacteria bacterium]|nr:hypothetical protein [Gammaproteobacteria bacterium]
MTYTAPALHQVKRFGILACLSLLLGSCGFHLQGQSQAAFPAQLNVYINDPVLQSVVIENLEQHQVELEILESVTETKKLSPTMQLTGTIKHRSELILDNNGDPLIWRYTLTTHYSYSDAGVPSANDNSQQTLATLPLSVSTDVDLSGTHATVNERIEADSWALLYQQLGHRIARQLSYE